MKLSCWCALLAGLALSAHAQSPDALYARSLAANCAACHGTDGHALDGATVPGLAGQSREELLQKLQSFRDGSRPSTVMQQIAKGFSEPQLQLLAAWFAAQRPVRQR